MTLTYEPGKMPSTPSMMPSHHPLSSCSMTSIRSPLLKVRNVISESIAMSSVGMYEQMASARQMTLTSTVTRSSTSAAAGSAARAAAAAASSAACAVAAWFPAAAAAAVDEELEVALEFEFELDVASPGMGVGAAMGAETLATSSEAPLLLEDFLDDEDLSFLDDFLDDEDLSFLDELELLSLSFLDDFFDLRNDMLVVMMVQLAVFDGSGAQARQVAQQRHQCVTERQVLATRLGSSLEGVVDERAIGAVSTTVWRTRARECACERETIARQGKRSRGRERRSIGESAA